MVADSQQAQAGRGPSTGIDIGQLRELLRDAAGMASASSFAHPPIPRTTVRNAREWLPLGVSTCWEWLGARHSPGPTLADAVSIRFVPFHLYVKTGLESGSLPIDERRDMPDHLELGRLGDLIGDVAESGFGLMIDTPWDFGKSWGPRWCVRIGAQDVIAPLGFGETLAEAVEEALLCFPRCKRGMAGSIEMSALDSGEISARRRDASDRPAAVERLSDPEAFLSRSDLRESGLERRAVDAVFRGPVVALPGYSRTLIRVADYLALLEQHTFRGDRVRSCQGEHSDL